MKILFAVLVFPLVCFAEGKDIWYGQFNYKLGLSTTYSDGVNSQLDSIGATNKSTSGLEGGAYFKMVVPQLYFGGVLSRYVNKFESRNGDNITAIIPAGSLIYSPKEDMADGPFGRFDLGLGFISRPDKSDAGLNYLLGIGWGFPFSDDFAMFTVFSMSSTYGSENYTYTTLGVGVIL